MYLEEIIIEGFKSYATRTVVGPFHPQFNAISGLNGTGKSNILDAICFAMGMRTLQEMRVAKVEELIYKRGLAGITKAGVTLVFCNDDAHHAPIGMAGIQKVTISRQISVGGRDRYILNGHTASVTDIQKVLQSVQLNPNSPVFIVMQGRITKVIHMKPLDLLALLEETAGTRLYEVKRTECMRKIALKESKLSEIEAVIKEQFEPSLEALQKSQAEYTTWLRQSQEITELETHCRAYDYYNVLQDQQQLNKQQQDLTSDLHHLEETAATAQNLAKTITNQIAELEKQQSSRAPKSAMLKEVYDKKLALEKKQTLHQVALAEAKKALSDHENEKSALQAKIDDINRQLEQTLASTSSIRSQEKALVSALDESTAKLTEIRDIMEELRTGSVCDPTKQTSKQKLTHAKIQLKQYQSEVKLLTKKIKDLEQDLSNSDATNQAQVSLHQMEQEYTVLLKQIEDHDNVADRMGELQQRLENLRNTLETQQGEIETIEDTIESNQHKLRQITRFQQETKHMCIPNIRGLAIQLFQITPDNFPLNVALEEAGKRHLFDIVVEDDSCAQAVLEKYKTIRRVTCIPLNRITASSIPTDKLQGVISELGETPSSVRRPVDIIKPMSPDLSTALAFVFGSTVICTSAQIAQKLVKSGRLKCTAVTLEGDVYSSSGSVSGGSVVGLGGVLLAYQTQLRNEQRKQALRHSVEDQLKPEIAELEKTLRMLKDKHQEQGQHQKNLKVLKDRMEYLKEFSSCGVAASLRSELDDAKARLDKLMSTSIPFLQNEEIPRLESLVKNLSTPNKSTMESYEAQLIEAQTQVEKADQQLLEFRKASGEALKQITVLQEQLYEAQKQLKKMRESTTSFQQDVHKEQLALDKASDLYTEAEKMFLRTESSLRERNEKLQRLGTQKKTAERNFEDVQIELEKVKVRLRSCKQKLIDINKRKSLLLHNFPILKQIAHEIVQPNYFNLETIPASFDRLEILKREAKRNTKRIKRDVSSTVEVCKNELEALYQKRDLLLRDKNKLEQFIEEFDQIKINILKQCWQQVNVNLNSIFGMLLPRSSVQLEPVSSQDLRQGFKTIVQLNQIQLSSLTELSGGQRALLALSLILALLKYKPAPLYILDEIDAALDLNHTQCIGEMIKHHFKSSQFIIISLKPNLFTHADILFTTSFVNGSSQIQRHVNGDKENSSERPFRALLKP